MIENQPAPNTYKSGEILQTLIPYGFITTVKNDTISYTVSSSTIVEKESTQKGGGVHITYNITSLSVKKRYSDYNNLHFYWAYLYLCPSQKGHFDYPSSKLLWTIFNDL